MSLNFRIFLLTAVAILATASAVFTQVQVPANTGYVNDLAGVMDPITKQSLETRLKALHDSTDAKIEIAVLTVKTTGDRDIFDFSLAVARQWKIGSKDSDNPGVLLTVAVDDRKYFTQVSRDAEGDIPDGLAGSLQRQYLVPAFKQGQYGKGIQDTVEAYIRRFGEVRGFDAATLTKTEGSTAPPVPGTTKKGGSSLFVCGVCGVIIVIIIFIAIVSSLSGAAGVGRRSSWNGGSFGGRKGGSDWGDSIAPVVIGTIIGSLLSGGGGSGGSGGGSSGGGDGGGWGGFGGGGDFGGGGAGGDW